MCHPPAAALFETGSSRMPQTRTVLVIDDDPNIREVLQLVLEDHGFRVIGAPDGEVGIDKALKDKPHLIIVDMMMPKVSGFIVLERLKHQHKLTTPIIMLTGNESDHQRAYAEFLGADLYLTKPIRPYQLFEAIARFLPVGFAPHSYATAATVQEPVGQRY